MTGTSTNGSRPRFSLERFDWIAPDRLEVSGWFNELSGVPRGAPVLRLRAGDRTYELTALAGGAAEPDDEDGRWRATFAWQENPVWFEAAELRVGADLVLELPPPGAIPAPELEPADDLPAPVGLERLRLHADLLALQEEMRDARALLDRTAEELRRARADLEAERERHVADAQRFRDSLARVRRAAEEAAASESAQVKRLERELAAIRAPAAGMRAAAQQLLGHLTTLERTLEPED